MSEIKIINRAEKSFIKKLEDNNIRGYAITLDFFDLNKEINTGAMFSSGDLNTSLIAIQLKLNGKNIVINNDTMVYANVSRADGKIFTNDCTILDVTESVILLKFKTQSISKQGLNRFEIVLKHGELEKIISPKVSYMVFNTYDSEINNPAVDEVSVLESLMNDVKSLKTDVGTFLVDSNETFNNKIVEVDTTVETEVVDMKNTVTEWFDNKAEIIVDNATTLNEAITVSTEAKNSLTSQNSSATTNINTLSNKIAEGNNISTVLTSKTSTANTSATTLQSKIDNANQVIESIGGVEGLITDMTEDLTGTDIKIDNSYSSDINNITIKGKTYQNLISYNEKLWEVNKWNNFVPKSSLLKPNTLYTIIITLKDSDINAPFNIHGDATNNSTCFLPPTQMIKNKGTTIITMTTKANLDDAENALYTVHNPLQYSGKGKATVIILEGDYTNDKSLSNDIDGIESVGEKEDNIVKIKSIGKNLFDIENIIRPPSVSCKVFSKVNGGFYTECVAPSTFFEVGVTLKPHTTYNIRGKISVIGGNQNAGNIDVYNTNGVIVKSLSHKNEMSQSFTTIENSEYLLRFQPYASGTDIGLVKCSWEYLQIEEGSKPTKYTPYQEDKTQISLSEPLRSLPSGIVDTIEKINGEYKVVRRVGKTILDETKSWSGFQGNDALPRAFFTPLWETRVISNLEQLNYINDKYLISRDKDIDGLWRFDSFQNKVAISDITSKYKTVQEFKDYLKANPVTLYYELETIIIEDLSEEAQYELNHIKTFQGVTHITSANNILPELTINVDKSIGGVVKYTVEKTDIIERELFDKETIFEDNKFKLDNTVNGVLTEVKLSGNTIQNLNPFKKPITHWNKGTSWVHAPYSHDFNLIEGSLYSIIISGDLPNFSFFRLGHANGHSPEQININKLNTVFTFKAKEILSNGITFIINSKSPHNWTQKQLEDFEVIILEGDWSNKQIPDFIEGVQGVGTKSRNLFDKNKALFDNYIDYKTGDMISGSPNSNKYYASDFINITDEKALKLINAGDLAFYDISKTFISGLTSTSQFIKPENAMYIRFSIRDYLIETCQLKHRDHSNVYEDYYDGVKLNLTSNNKNLFNSSDLVRGAIGFFVGNDIDNAFEIVGSGVYRISTKPTQGIMVEGNTEYIISTKMSKDYKFGVQEYDINRKAIKDSGWIICGSDKKIATTSKTRYIYFVFARATESGTSTIPLNLSEVVDVQVELGNETSKYKDCDKKETNILLNTQLHQLPNGVKDTIELINGKYKVVRRVGEVILDGSSDEIWGEGSKTSSTRRFYILKTGKVPTRTKNIICDKLPYAPVEHDATIGVAEYETDDRLYIKQLDTVVTGTIGEWLSANPVKVLFELAEPIIEDLTDKEDLALKTLRTFDEITYIDCNTSVKPDMKIELYDRSLRGQLNTTRKRVENLEEHILELKMMFNRLLGNTLEEPQVK